MVKGRDLYNLLLELSGLESDQARADIEKRMNDLGLDPDNLDTDSLRKFVAHYLEEVHLTMLDLQEDFFATEKDNHLLDIAEA